MSIENPTEYFIQALTESQNRLYGYIFSLVGEHHAASDILQECNLVLWRKFGEFRPESDFIPWAFAIARFQVLAHLRDRKRSDIARNFLFHPLGSLPAEGPGSEGVRLRSLSPMVFEAGMM